jgi:hypothetical protein
MVVDNLMAKTISTAALANAAIIAGAVIKASPGRLLRVLVTTLIGANPISITDGPGGTVIGIVPASTAVGTIFDFEMPAANSIVTAPAAGGGAVTVSFN